MNPKQLLIKTWRLLDRSLGIRAWLSSEPHQMPKGGFDIHGEKELDWGWIAANIPHLPGMALDVGCYGSPICCILASMGYRVIGVDLRPEMPFDLAQFEFVHGEFNHVTLPLASFNLAVLCSVVEHIGLDGRYDNPSDPDGDIKAMKKVMGLLKPDGICILNIPVGIDAVYSPWHRVYGRGRLPELLQGYNVVKSRFFAKQPWKNWCETDEEHALSYPATAARYALGQYVLRLKQDVGARS